MKKEALELYHSLLPNGEHAKCALSNFSEVQAWCKAHDISVKDFAIWYMHVPADPATTKEVGETIEDIDFDSDDLIGQLFMHFLENYEHWHVVIFEGDKNDHSRWEVDDNFSVYPAFDRAVFCKLVSNNPDGKTRIWHALVADWDSEGRFRFWITSESDWDSMRDIWHLVPNTPLEEVCCCNFYELQDRISAVFSVENYIWKKAEEAVLKRINGSDTEEDKDEGEAQYPILSAPSSCA